MWGDDGATVTKVRLAAADARRRYANERRVNRMLAQQRPPVATPRLLDDDARRLSLTFDAVDGDVLGPKYPHELSDGDIDGMVDIGQRLGAYRPRRRWFRRFDSARRLELARGAGLLTDAQAGHLTALAARYHRRLRFAHGDLTARNVLRTAAGLTLIDWEWAGLYPPGYELAFLWYSLVELPPGRAQVEERHRAGGSDAPSFLLSALLIQLWHLQWFVPTDHRPKHLTTRDALLARLSS